MDTYRASLVFALRAMADITGVILVPAVVSLVCGKFLDSHFGTGKVLVMSLLAVSFLGTAVILVKKVRQYAKEYQQLIAR